MAQGNNPIDKVLAISLTAVAKQGRAAELMDKALKPTMRIFFAAPWIRPDPYERIASMRVAELIAVLSEIPPGVMNRDGATLDSPPRFQTSSGFAIDIISITPGPTGTVPWET